MKKSKSSAVILPKVTSKSVCPERKHYLPNPNTLKPSISTFTKTAVNPALSQKVEPTANSVCAYRQTMSHAKPLESAPLQVSHTLSEQRIFREQLKLQYATLSASSQATKAAGEQEGLSKVVSRVTSMRTQNIQHEYNQNALLQNRVNNASGIFSDILKKFVADSSPAHVKLGQELFKSTEHQSGINSVERSTTFPCYQTSEQLENQQVNGVHRSVFTNTPTVPIAITEPEPECKVEALERASEQLCMAQSDAEGDSALFSLCPYGHRQQATDDLSTVRCRHCQYILLLRANIIKRIKERGAETPYSQVPTLKPSPPQWMAASSMVSPIPMPSDAGSINSPSLASPASAGSPAPLGSPTLTVSPLFRRSVPAQRPRKNHSWIDFSTLLSSQTRQSVESPLPLTPAPPLAIEAQAAPHHQSIRDWSTSPRVHQPVLIHHSLRHAPANRDTARQHKTQQAKCSSSEVLPENKVPPITLPLLQKLGMCAGSDPLAISLSYPDRSKPHVPGNQSESPAHPLRESNMLNVRAAPSRTSKRSQNPNPNGRLPLNAPYPSSRSRSRGTGNQTQSHATADVCTMLTATNGGVDVFKEWKFGDPYTTRMPEALRRRVAELHTLVVSTTRAEAAAQRLKHTKRRVIIET